MNEQQQQQQTGEVSPQGQPTKYINYHLKTGWTVEDVFVVVVRVLCVGMHSRWPR